MDSFKAQIAVAFIFLSCFSYGQESTSVSFKQVDSLFKIEAYDLVSKIDKNEIVCNGNIELAKLHFIIGKSYENLNHEDKALSYYKKALKIFEEEQDLENIAKINLEIYLLIDSQNSLEANKDNYLNAIYKYALTSKSKKWLASYYTNYGVEKLKSNKGDSAKYYFLKALRLAKELDSTEMQTNISINIGSTFSRKFQNQDSAIFYYHKALSIYYRDTITSKNLNTEFYIFNNLGNAYRRKKDYNKALAYFEKAEKLELPKLNRKSKKILYSNMDATYYYMKDWYNAYDYLYKYDSIKDIINLKEQNSTIADIEEKYDNEKLRADNLESEAKRIQNRNLLFGSLGVLLFGGITFLLVQKNTKRKQKLAEQEKEIESQKLATVLKEQELTAIDAMIEGQEHVESRSKIA